MSVYMFSFAKAQGLLKLLCDQLMSGKDIQIEDFNHSSRWLGFRGDQLWLIYKDNGVEEVERRVEGNWLTFYLGEAMKNHAEVDHD